MEQGDENEKLHRIEDVKSKLFSRSFDGLQLKSKVILKKVLYDVPKQWKDEETGETLANKIFMKTSIFKKFFIFSVVFFSAAILFAGITFFRGGNTVSNNNIDIEILGNAFTAGGEDLPLQIEITNKNSAALELVDLLIEYPKGAATDFNSGTERLRESIGTIPAGRVSNNNIKVNLFGEQGSIKPIKVSIEYRVEGSNSIFIKEKDYAVSISSAPIDLSLEAPREVSPNQEITFKIKAVMNSSRATSGLLMKADYPLGFQFSSATPSPKISNNVWDFGDMSPGAEKEIEIKGRMIDVDDGEEKSFHFFTGTPNDSDKSLIGVVFNSLGHTILIKKPFIQARLLVNGIYGSSYATNSKNSISGQIEWVNNLGTSVNDVEIRAKLSGNVLDRNNVSSAGFYDSINNTIVWDKNSYSQFAEIAPGESGTVEFLMTPLPVFSSEGLISEPSINIELSITGKQPIEGNAVNTVTDSETKVIKLISDTSLASKATFSTGAFTNTGTLPPQAEKETTYTVNWSLSNTSNVISNANVKAILPVNVRFVGTVSPAIESVVFDAATREVTWDIGSIQKGASILNTGKSVSFQVAIKPSLSEVGTIPVILNESILTGHDDFANVDVHSTRPKLTTKLTNDPAFAPGKEFVIK